MAVESGIYSDTNTHDHEASTSKSQEQEEKGSGVNEHPPEMEKSKGDEKLNSVPFHKLFSFADSADIILMIIGTTGAVGNGLSLPLMTIFVGNTIDAFGNNQNNKDVVHAVTKVNMFSTSFKYNLI